MWGGSFRNRYWSTEIRPTLLLASPTDRGPFPPKTKRKTTAPLHHDRPVQTAVLQRLKEVVLTDALGLRPIRFPDAGGLFAV